MNKHKIFTYKKKYKNTKNKISKNVKNLKKNLETKFKKINIKTIKTLRKKFKKFKTGNGNKTRNKSKTNKKRNQIGCSSKNSVCIMKGGGTDLIFQAGLDVSNKIEDNVNSFVNNFMGNNQIPTSNVTDQPYLGIS